MKQEKNEARNHTEMPATELKQHLDCAIENKDWSRVQQLSRELARRDAESDTAIKVHPLMERLFSGDLKAVHGSTFGDRGSSEVECEHHFLKSCLQQIFYIKSEFPWEDSISAFIGLESVIRHCPKLQNEAAAIRALLEAESVLSEFCYAVNAC